MNDVNGHNIGHIGHGTSGAAWAAKWGNQNRRDLSDTVWDISDISAKAVIGNAYRT